MIFTGRTKYIAILSAGVTLLLCGCINSQSKKLAAAEPVQKEHTPSYDYDPTIDLSYTLINDYGTTSPFGEMAVNADRATLSCFG